MATYLHSHIEYDNALHEQQSQAQATIVKLDKSITQHINDLAALNAFFSSSSEVTQSEFTQFIQLQKHEFLSMLWLSVDGVIYFTHRDHHDSIFTNHYEDGLRTANKACADLFKLSSSLCFTHHQFKRGLNTQKDADLSLLITQGVFDNQGVLKGYLLGEYSLTEALYNILAERQHNDFIVIYVDKDGQFTPEMLYGNQGWQRVSVLPESSTQFSALHRVVGEAGQRIQISLFYTIPRFIVDEISLFMVLLGLFLTVLLYIMARDKTRNADQLNAVLQSEANNAKRLQIIIDRSLSGLVVFDDKGVIISCNQSANSLLAAQSIDGIVGRNIIEFLPKSEADTFESFTQALSQTAREREVMYTLQELSGRVLTVEMSYEDFYERGGTNHFIFFRDITEQLVTQKQNQAILENIPDMAWIKDITGTFVAVNKAFCDEAHLSRDEIVGGKDLDLWPRDIALGYMRDDNDVMQSKQGKTIQETFKVPDSDELRWIQTIKTPIFDINGEVSGTVGIARDISSLLEAQNKLSVISQEQQTLLNGVLFGVVFIKQNAQGKSCIVRCNTRFEEILGYRSRELVGVPIQHLFIDDGGTDIIERQYERLRKDNFYHGEHRLLSKDGQSFWGAITGRAIDSTKPELGTVWALQDISEQKETEQQLMRAQKMEAIGQLTGGLAHDFNNLLGIVIGNLDLILDDTVEVDEYKTHIDIALSAALRGANITKTLMGVAKRQSGERDYLSAGDLITRLRPLIDSISGSKAKVNVQLNAEFDLVNVDESAMESAILNAVINARDAIEESGTITISTANVNKRFHDQEQLFVEMTIADNGKGIPQHLLENIFEPFVSTKAPGLGTGLGLTMIRNFVQNEQGEIELSSQPNRGTALKLYLPTALNEKVEMLDESAPVMKQSLNILVVDDQTDLLDAISKMLQGECNSVATLSSPMAVETYMDNVAESNPIDVLITDIVMHDEIDGFALAEMIQQKYPEVKILFMSGYIGDSRIEEKLQPNTILSKPFRKADLLAAITALYTT
jgi:PAS domain S-box-containing protein